MFPAFGMAEVAIAGTFPEPMSGLRTDPVDLRVLEAERYAAPVDATAPGARSLAILGRPVLGLEIRVVDPITGDELKDREVGELEIRGTSVTPGYYKRPDANAELFHDGWLRTGDLAYLLDGEMVMCGRIKDMIIVGGRNVFPEDVERALADVDGVRAGNVIAFGIDGHQGKEGLVVVAESKGDDHAEVRRSVAQRVRDAIGLPAKEIVLVEPGSLPEDELGQAPALALQDPLPRPGAPSGVARRRPRPGAGPGSGHLVSGRCQHRDRPPRTSRGADPRAA